LLIAERGITRSIRAAWLESCIVMGFSILP